MLKGGNFVTWFLQPEVHLVILVAYWRCSVMRLRDISPIPFANCSRRSNRFGQGDFAARARVNRGDEIGSSREHSTRWRIACKR